MCYCYFHSTSVSTVLGRVTLIVSLIQDDSHVYVCMACTAHAEIAFLWDRLLRSAMVPDNFLVLSHPAAVKVLPDCFRVCISFHPIPSGSLMRS